nr:hypothetical protein HmN_000568100 [Hymenolepis microstoma]
MIQCHESGSLTDDSTLVQQIVPGGCGDHYRILVVGEVTDPNRNSKDGSSAGKELLEVAQNSRAIMMSPFI